VSNLTQAQRDALPDSSFGWPEEKKYPILDASDVADAAALIGKAPEGMRDRIKRRIIAIAKRKGFPIPDAWKDEKTASMAADLVYRSGLIFKAGSYEDKDLVVGEDDLAAVCAAFTAPVDAELEHINTLGIKTFLDGKLGKLVAIWQQGAELFGQVAVPAWLDPLWAEAGRKVSIVWDAQGPAIARIGLVLHPRVKEATVMSAYATFAGRRHSTADAADMQQIHDLACRQGADCTPAQENSMGNSVAGMSRRESRMDGKTLGFWGRLGRRARDEARAGGIAAVPEETVFSALEDAAGDATAQARKDLQAEYDAKLAALETERQKTAAELLRATTTRLQAESAAFADSLITEGKILPAEREALIAKLTQDGLDDAAHGVVTFAHGTTGSRVEQTKAMYTARTPHGLLREAGQAPFSVLAGGAQPAPTERTADELLAMTPLGRKALEAKRARAAGR
jgi:hypothetical protein